MLNVGKQKCRRQPGRYWLYFFFDRNKGRQRKSKHPLFSIWYTGNFVPEVFPAQSLFIGPSSIFFFFIVSSCHYCTVTTITTTTIGYPTINTTTTTTTDITQTVALTVRRLSCKTDNVDSVAGRGRIVPFPEPFIMRKPRRLIIRMLHTWL